MLISCRNDLTAVQRDAILRAAREAGYSPQALGADRIALHGAGDLAAVRDLPGIERIEPLPTSPRLVREAGRRTVRVGSIEIGPGFVVAAGPCAVESRARLLSLARAVKAAGGTLLRGGAFKPRTSPYSFRGLGQEGLEILAEARAETGLPIVTEVLDTRDVAAVAAVTDLIQIGTRNMMNYPLLVEVGRTGKPVLLKRGMGATIEETIHAAEYLLVEGASGVVFCERGIRTTETSVRNTLDVAAVPLLHMLTNLPVIVDPSHAVGRSDLVPAMARAGAAVGADGILIEIHEAPDEALCDGRQAVAPAALAALVENLKKISALAKEAEHLEAT